MTLLAAGVSLTRVNDGQFTATGGPYATAAYMVGHGVDWTKYQTAAHNQTGVHLDWSFNQRATQAGYTSPPTWYASTPGCLGCTMTQFNYPVEKCIAMVGIVPFYSGSPLGGSTPTGGGSPPASTPIENFPNEVLFPFPDVVLFDTPFGAHWQGAIMLSMPDPFWQNPFNPDCALTGLQWAEDDGSGEADQTGPPVVNYYAHHPLVEAITSSAGLPAGVKVTYDPTNQIGPPYYPTGIPIGDAAGDYGGVATDWGFAAAACANITASGRFFTNYMEFVYC
jgi:hypothetical protein